MIQLSDISKVYTTGAGPLPVLEKVSLSIAKGDALSIMGASGCGKSTLLHVLGLLDPPTSGTYEFAGERPLEMKEELQARFRNHKLGFVFQDHCLLPQCTVIENVLAPTLVGSRDGDPQKRAEELLDRVGLKARMQHRPGQLSGGEKQRVAIARALIRQPLLLLCDEPTGNLDEATAASVTELLLELQGETGMMMVVVTHSPALGKRMPRQLRITAGRLEE